jgi:hypothetical protein
MTSPFTHTNWLIMLRETVTAVRKTWRAQIHFMGNMQFLKVKADGR